MILGKIISIDDWVPERPPKPKNSIENVVPFRIPSPDLPPPPPAENISMPLTEQDETLPLPPIEILKQEYETKINHPPSRRNSFAGQGNLPPKVIKNMNIHLSPPAIPMRPKIIPTPIMTINNNSATYHLTHDHNIQTTQTKVQKQCSSERIAFSIQEPESTPPHSVYNRSSDQRISVRKRAHNSSSKDCISYTQTPPPLKPRMRNQNESNTHLQMSIASNKVR